MPGRIALALVLGGGAGLLYGQVIMALYSYIDVAIFSTINTILGG